MKPLMLVYALVLALPSGWCCLLPLQSVQAANEQSKPSCCSKAAAHPNKSCCSRKTNRPTAPACPSPLVKACCCSTQLTPPPDRVAPDQPEAIANLVLADADFATAGGFFAQRHEVPFPSLSCPLQLLLCVWRC